MGYCCQNHPFPSLPLFSHWHALYYLVVVEVVFFSHGALWDRTAEHAQSGEERRVGKRKKGSSRVPQALALQDHRPGRHAFQTGNLRRWRSLKIPHPLQILQPFHQCSQFHCSCPALFPCLSGALAHSCRGQRAELVGSTKHNTYTSILATIFSTYKTWQNLMIFKHRPFYLLQICGSHGCFFWSGMVCG